MSHRIPTAPDRALRAALVAGVLGVLGSTPLRAQVQFSGVASGDASSSAAIVWTRAVDPGAPAATSLQLELAPNDPTLTSGVATYALATDPAADYTAKFALASLAADTRYYYRFSVVGNPATASQIGTFKTAPSAGSATAVHLAFSGDCDGLMRPYPLADFIGARSLDFFVFLGDTIYETASSGSPAVTLSGTVPTPSSTGATQNDLLADYARKYREQFVAVNPGGQNCLQTLFASQGNYTLLDNHELGNRQYINGGAVPGGTVGGMSTGAGVDARVATNDVNAGPDYMNRALGFLTLQQVFLNYQPILDRGLVAAPADPRSDGTRLLYFAQSWGQNVVFFSVDDRSYRDIRMKTAANADDTTAPRANNPARTMLGATQLAWLEQSLLAAQTAGVPWKIVALSSPIDQLGPIGGSLGSLGNNVATDGGKSWMGGYRAERNALLKFIADNQILNVVFLATDDHQNRVNEVLYSPTGQTEDQASYVALPHCFTIVDGPLGATGPDTILDHSTGNIQSIAVALATAQAGAGLDPLGLAAAFPGLHDVAREGDPTADATRTAFDFYSPDTFNFATLDVSANGATLTVTLTGINSTPVNSFLEYDPIGNPARQILSFRVDAFGNSATGTAYCGAGDSNLTANCAGPDGAPGNGCANSVNPAGAALAATGSGGTLVLTSSGELPSALSILVQGSASLPAGVPFGDGIRCVGGSLKRLYVHNAVGGVVALPQGTDLPVQSRSAQLGDVILSGTTRYYQVYYRDPAGSGAQGFNVGNALSISWP
jgi:phosphodiesterase/alkaline phosphatase D-like protein